MNLASLPGGGEPGGEGGMSRFGLLGKVSECIAARDSVYGVVEPATWDGPIAGPIAVPLVVFWSGEGPL